jgi:hypothetical protein
VRHLATEPAAAVARGVVVLNGFGQPGVTLLADTGTATARIDFGASFDGGGLALERDTPCSRPPAAAAATSSTSPTCASAV